MAQATLTEVEDALRDAGASQAAIDVAMEHLINHVENRRIDEDFAILVDWAVEHAQEHADLPDETAEELKSEVWV